MLSEKTLSIQWNQLALEAIKLTKTAAPLAARALAMVHTAMYDAWSVYDKCSISTTTAKYIKIKGSECTAEHIRKAFSYAAYRVLMDLFWLELPSTDKNMFRDLMCECDYDPDDPSMEISKPQGIGNLVARLVIEQKHGDESNQLGTLHMPRWTDYTDYQSINTDFLVPHWGLLKSFALQFNWQFRPDPPFRKEQAEFRQQAKALLDISAALTDEQKAIAEYWDDGKGTVTSPGHWCEIAAFTAEREQYKNSNCIKLFFALSNALLDTSIACWEAKHFYHSVRPVAAIRTLYCGEEIQAWAGPHQGTQTILGEQWRPYLNTPAFPEHVSVHSAFSKAAAIILKQFTGSDDFGACTKIKSGSSQIEPGSTPCADLVLDWPTFSIAAEQAGLSGIYGGTHFARGNEEGMKLGLAIGTNTWEKAKFYFNDVV